MRDILQRVSQEADVKLYAFSDDLNMQGEPAEVMKGFAALQRLLPTVSLKCNTAKSQFAYFHDDTAPLLRSIRETLAEHNIETRTEWISLVGAVVGKDEATIKAGLAAQLDADQGQAAFFRRLQLDDLPVQSAMLLLRQCAVPKMNYVLRCAPPPCIAEQAAAFDHQVLHAGAMEKLRLRKHERSERVQRFLRAKLKHGGFGLTSALQTSPFAYLGSLAAVHTAPVLAAYADRSHLLPASTMLHSWIESSMQTIVAATPSSARVLPTSAAVFFHAYAKDKAPLTTSLQRTLSSLASSHSHQALLNAAEEAKRRGDGRELSHLKAITAPRAPTWKLVIPTEKALTLSDAAYRLSARQNLGLPLDPTWDPTRKATCSACGRQTTDPWHSMGCTSNKGATLRHDTVLAALHQAALAVGAVAEKEPEGLTWEDGRKPDLLMLMAGRSLLTDVVVTHALAPGYTDGGNGIAHRSVGAARHWQRVKHRKYDETAESWGFQLLPLAVETTGGMAPDAVNLLKAMAEESEEQLGLWHQSTILKHVHGLVAIALQRGNALKHARIRMRLDEVGGTSRKG
jgi:hypothetical protein